MFDLTNTIESIELIEVELPLVHPFRTSFGTENHKQAILVKITDQDDNVGWGETSVSTNPGYCYETLKTAWHIQTDFLIPMLNSFIANKEIFNILDLNDNWDSVRGHEFAKSGLESALWVLKSLQEKVSLGKLYNSKKDKIPTGVSVGIQPSIKELISRIDQFLDRGYHRIKIKIEPGWDVEPIKEIRKQFGDIQLMVDANSSYSLSRRDVTTLKELDKFNLTMIEQPLKYNDMLLHKDLQTLISTPVCLDESIHNPNDAQMALENDCCKIINIKPARVGGYAKAMEIAELGGPGKVWCGGMLETGIGRVHNLIFQSSENFTIPGDTSGSDRYFTQDIISPAVIVDDDGFIEIPKDNGLGYSILEDQIDIYTKKTYIFEF